MSSLNLLLFLLTRIDYDPVNVEDDVEAVIIDNSEAEDGENGLSTQSCVSMEQNSEVNSNVHHVPQLAYGNCTSFSLVIS